MTRIGQSQTKTKTKVWMVENGKARSHSDQLATEEPLEIRFLKESSATEAVPSTKSQLPP